MGLCSSKMERWEDEMIPEPDEPPADPTGQVFMLITGIDYSCDRVSWAGPPPNGHGPLDTQHAYNMMIDLAKQVGATGQVDIQTMTLWNEQCTKEGILEGIAEMASQCGPDDYFVFYYTGHGDLLPQDDAGEAEEMDNCLCTVGPDGSTDGPQPDVNVRLMYWLRDDDLAKAILDNINDKAYVLLLADACHSGSICDFTPGSEWDQRDIRAISICGCEDQETSAGTGQGGKFSRALAQTIMEESQAGESFAVSNIYNKIVQNYHENQSDAHVQHITINCNDIEPSDFIWPLQPGSGYVSPFAGQMR